MGMAFYGSALVQGGSTDEVEWCGVVEAESLDVTLKSCPAMEVGLMLGNTNVTSRKRNACIAVVSKVEATGVLSTGTKLEVGVDSQASSEEQKVLRSINCIVASHDSNGRGRDFVDIRSTTVHVH